MAVSILIVPGSVRTGSHNLNLAKVAERDLAAMDVSTEIFDPFALQMPIYDGDLERQDGVPQAAIDLAARLRAHPAALLVSPEYNAGVSPLLKNAIDWVSRVKDEEVSPFKNRLFALASASPGGFGGLRGLMALRQTLELGLGALVIPEQLILSAVHQALSADGRFADPAHETRMKGFLEAVVRRTESFRT